MNTLHSTIAAALLMGAASVHAANFTLAGQITHHKDVVQVDISLIAPGTDVRVWSDSWLSGLNFDPIAAVWARSGSDFTLISQVDDDDTVASISNNQVFGAAFEVQQGTNCLQPSAQTTPPANPPALAP